MKSKQADKPLVNKDHDFEAFDQFLDEFLVTDNTLPPDFADKSEEAPPQTFLGPSGSEICFVRPGGRQPVFPEYMEAVSLETKNILAAEEISISELQQARVLVAFSGDLLAFEREKNCPSETGGSQGSSGTLYVPENALTLEPGSHVKRTVKGEYFAERYGFVCLVDNQLTVLSPIRINSDMLKVEWLVPANHPSGVDRQMLDFWLTDRGVLIEPVADLDALIKTVNKGSSDAELYSIASGQAAVPGEDGRIEWLVNVGQTSGKEHPDGRIDFRERDYVVT